MLPATVYDPEVEPDAQLWLALDEQSRITLAETFHRRAKTKLPSVKAHAVMHAIVENQVAMKLEPIVRAVQRLLNQGLSRHDAIHAVGSVLAEHLHEQITTEDEDSAEISTSRYMARVERLDAKDWLAKCAGDA
jgi:uncharacterized protein YoaH (UPF0181 family)